jgi:hypothetical protein
VNHGCTYGHSDCPVVNRTVQQEYLCEYCNEDNGVSAQTIVHHGKTHLVRADGTVNDIPSEEDVETFIKNLLKGQTINGWIIQ